MLSMAILPNEDGYRFIGAFEDGSSAECVVKVGPAGMHNVYRIDNDEPCFFLLRGWTTKKLAKGEQL